MIELLQNKNKGKIVLINSGAFYVARGKDAILLHNLLNLKLNCIETEICKIGFPINSIEKYTKLIEEKGYSYIVYNFDNKTGKLREIKQNKGKRINTIKENKLNCYMCKNTTKIYKSTDKYIQAVSKLYEEEFNKNKEEKRKENE